MATPKILKQERRPYEPAMLVCLHCQCPTVHKFKYGVYDRDNRRHVLGIATYYECETCGTDRVWGYELPYSTHGPQVPRLIDKEERDAA